MSCKRSSQARMNDEARRVADEALHSVFDAAIEARAKAGRSCTFDGCDTMVALRGSVKPRTRKPIIQ
eukprot:4632045-Pleurochrysis_carterae.AAC.1